MSALRPKADMCGHGAVESCRRSLPTLFVSQTILRMFSYPCCSHVVWSHRHRLTPIENAWKNLVTCMKKGRFISGLFLFGLSIQCFKLVAGEGLEPPTSGL